MKKRSKFRRRVAAVAVALAAAGTFTAAAGSPASAANYDGSCDYGEVCLWYLAGHLGPSADFYDNVSNYNNWHFYNSSYWLANNTESVKNRSYHSCVRLYDNANYSGKLKTVEGTAESGNLGDAKNRIESHDFYSSFPIKCSLP